MIKTVDDEWLDQHVEKTNAAPHAVYVTDLLGGMDTAFLANIEVLEALQEIRRLAVVVVDYTSEFAERHQVLYVPTLLLLRSGNVQLTASGVLPLEPLVVRATKIAQPSPAELISEQIAAQQEQ